MDNGEPGREALLQYIGSDGKLQALAAQGDTLTRKYCDHLEPGSSDFYAKVLEYVRHNANVSPKNYKWNDKPTAELLQFGQPGDPAGDSWKKPPPPLPSFEAPPSFYCGMEE